MRKMICLVMLLALMSLVGGCSFWKREAVTPDPPIEDRPSDSVQMRETVFYYPDKDWQFVVPVRFSIPWQEGIARATINCMIQGQVPPELTAAGFSPLLPQGTEILGLTIKDGMARIDFNRSFLNYTPAHERLLLDGLIYTLTEFPTVNRVEIMVEGEKITKLPSGESLSEPLNRERGLNLTVSGDVSDFAVTDRVVLFFLHSAAGKTFFVPVTRVIRPAENKLEATVTELLRGPAHGSRLYSAIPRGVYLEKATVSKNRATLRINGDITATGGGQAAADHIRDQFALTVGHMLNVTEIEVLAAGRVPKFPGGVTFPEVFGKTNTWNRIAETVQPDKR